MTTYKLIYFNFRGRAEAARILFDIVGQKFEDKRLTFEEWPEAKLKTPFHKVPLLEVTENEHTYQIAQSHAIIRYLAEKFNLAGKTDIERAQCDMIVEQIVDMLNTFVGVYSIKDKDELEKKLEETLTEYVPKNLKLIQNILEANKQGNGFLVGDSLSYADVELMVFYDTLRARKVDILEKLPILKQHNEKIRSLPKVAEHLQKNAHVHLSYLFAN